MALDFAYLQGAESSSDLTTYTFSTQNLGVADSARYIIVGIMARAIGGSTTVSSVTVGGISATLVVEHFNSSSNSDYAGLWIAAVPTGTTGDVVVTFSAGQLRAHIDLWRAVNISSATATDTDKSTASPPSVALDIPAGGFAIGCGCSGAGGSSCTWTGLTENNDRITESLNGSVASDVFASAQTGLTITATFSSAVAPVSVFAAWDDAAGGGVGGQPTVKRWGGVKFSGAGIQGVW